jgi:hypothetical protein
MFVWYNANIKYDEMTREERAALLARDVQAYMDLVPLDQGIWYQILDGVSVLKPYEGE